MQKWLQNTSPVVSAQQWWAAIIDKVVFVVFLSLTFSGSPCTFTLPFTHHCEVALGLGIEFGYRGGSVFPA